MIRAVSDLACNSYLFGSIFKQCLWRDQSSAYQRIHLQDQYQFA